METAVESEARPVSAERRLQELAITSRFYPSRLERMRKRCRSDPFSF
jgi:hypothetical protein